VRETLTALARTTDAWRRYIYGGRLDPYLARGRTHLQHRFMMLKSAPNPPPELTLARDTAEERWGPEGAGAISGWLDRHPHAEALRLTLTAPSPGLQQIADGRTVSVGADATMGVFDLLLVPASGPSTVTVGWGRAAPLAVRLPAGAELAHVDVLRLVYAQHRAEIVRRASGPTRDGNPLLLPHLRARTDAGDWLADFWLF
jgi:hypothetical protein